MIRQYQLCLTRPDGAYIPSSWAYKLYAWLLLQLPEETAERFHQPGQYAVSQYVHKGVWTVSLFGQEAAELLGPVLERAKRIALHEGALSVSMQDCRCAEGAEHFLRQGQLRSRKRIKLELLTPTAFKQNGRYAILPQERLLVQSLLNRWNRCFPEYLLEDADLLEELIRGVHIVDYRLRTGRYALKNTAIPGFYGTLWLEAGLPVVLQELWCALLDFAQYSGIGIKTTLGMGGAALIANNGDSPFAHHS